MSADGYAGLRVLVTGGASGIGHAVAAAAVRRGARVAVLDFDPAGPPAGVIAFHADVSDDAAVAEAVQRAASTTGGVDLLVNNAVIAAPGTIAANSLDEWRHVLDVNVLGIVRVTRSALARLRQSANAAVVNVCSIAATAGLPGRGVYSASKGAVLSLTMAADHVAEGIRVKCVNPGTVDTPRVGRLLDQAANPAAERSALEARQPTGRLTESPRPCCTSVGRRLARRPARRSPSTVGCRGSASATLPLTLGRRQEDSDLNYSPNFDHLTPTLGES